jgi:hypothetical protein
MQMHASWDIKQSSFWLFSFSLNKKFIFYFPSVKEGFSVKEVEKIHIKIVPP